ncbi:hypothetical protein C0993_008900, partial [Termitomyces sp. T159_Od127]
MLSSDQKAKVKTAVAGSKVLHAVPARVYYAYPDPAKWSYAGVEGAIAFVKDDATGVWSFKLVDLDGTGVVWEHELYSGLEYHTDRPFFHSFAGDECMIGFVFPQASEKEAKAFCKKVKTRKEEKSPKSPKKKTKTKLGKGGKIDKSLISAPTAGSFVHVGHMGYDEDKGFVSRGVDPSWKAFLTDLESGGVPKEVIEKNEDFIKDFVRDFQKQQPAPQKEPKKPKPPPPAPRRLHIEPDTESSQAPAPPPP